MSYLEPTLSRIFYSILKIAELKDYCSTIMLKWPYSFANMAQLAGAVEELH